MDPYDKTTLRRQPTREEQTRERVDRSARAWRETRARVAGWPADLAAEELRRTSEAFGAEPGTGADASVRQAEQLAAALPRVAAAERRPVDAATRTAAERLLAGSATPAQEEAARRLARPPA